jgi:hypothetical protein
VQVASATPEYAAQWLEYLAPEHLAAGQMSSAIIEVKNTGSKTWPSSGTEAVRLGYRWTNADGQVVPLPEAKTQALPTTIRPGETARFRTVPYATPQLPGAYLLVWDLWQAGAWLSSQGAAVREQAVQLVPPEYALEWHVLQPWPGWVAPSTSQPASLTLRNTGTRTWAAGGENPVHLAYHWFTENGGLVEPWDTFRTLLPVDVPPNSAVEIDDIWYTTPAVPGRYILRWDLVEEARHWFFRQGGRPLEVLLEVSQRALTARWTAQASHNSQEASLAFDGKPDTAWTSQANQEPGMWFQVDLGQPLVLDRLCAHSPGRGFPAGYQVKLSEDGQAWRLVAEQQTNWGNIDVAFAPCKARYVRMEQTATPEWPSAWMITEISVSVTQAWAGAQASHYTADADKAWDAHLPTHWTTRAIKQKPGLWFELDMGSLRRVDRVLLEHPANQFPRGYRVEISADAQNWREVGRNDDNWEQVDVQFQPLVARHVRIETTQASESMGWGISEVRIWRTSPTWLRGMP